MTADQALRQLLAGSGLTYQFLRQRGDRGRAAGDSRAGRSTTGSNVIQLDPVRVQAQHGAAAGRDRQPAAGLCRRPGGARRQGRPARQPRLHGHAVQPDDLHQRLHPEPAGALAHRRAGDRPDPAHGLSERQRLRRPRRDPRHPGLQPQFRLRRPLRDRAQPGGPDRRRTDRDLPRADRLPERRAAAGGRRDDQPGPEARDRRSDHARDRALLVGCAVRRRHRCRPPLRPGQRHRRARQCQLHLGADLRLEPDIREAGRDARASTIAATARGSMPTSAT